MFLITTFSCLFHIKGSTSWLWITEYVYFSFNKKNKITLCKDFQPNSTFVLFSLPLPTFFYYNGHFCENILASWGFIFSRCYSPAVVTIPWFTNYGVPKIRNSFPFVSQPILSWYLIAKYSSRLFSCTFLEKHPFHFSSLVIHFFSLQNALLQLGLHFIKMPHPLNSLLPTFTSALTSLTCWHDKRLKSSTESREL